MATYRFSTITPAQALAITADDTVVVDGFSATAATVVVAFQPNNAATVDVTFGGRTVSFGPAAAGSGDIFTFGDGSELYIGWDIGSSSQLVDDYRVAGATNDALFGLGGRDNLRGGDGNDLLQGNQGADLLTGGRGADTVYGGQGDDEVARTEGDDGPNFVNGNKGNDWLWGGRGADTLLGGQGDDTLLGDGPNYLSGDLGNDRILAGTYADTIFGGDGRDEIYGGGGADTIKGGADWDTIWGDAGNDVIDGGQGNDFLLGRAGADVLTGGEGFDFFVFAVGDSPAVEGVFDHIADWTSFDRLDLRGAGSDTRAFVAVNDAAIDTFQEAKAAAAAKYADPNLPTLAYVAVQVGGDVLVFYNEGADVVQLDGASTASLTAGNFERWEAFIG